MPCGTIQLSNSGSVCQSTCFACSLWRMRVVRREISPWWRAPFVRPHRVRRLRRRGVGLLLWKSWRKQMKEIVNTSSFQPSPFPPFFGTCVVNKSAFSSCSTDVSPFPQNLADFFLSLQYKGGVYGERCYCDSDERDRGIGHVVELLNNSDPLLIGIPPFQFPSLSPSYPQSPSKIPESGNFSMS